MFGVEDKMVREWLLRETKLILEGAIKILHAIELSQLHVRGAQEPQKPHK